jgi:hypothetical protein
MSRNDRKSTLSLKHSISVQTSMNDGMYGCMRSESESELGNQLSGILRKAHKQTCILVCLCMHVCMRSERESASHSSPPQLKGVRVISTCVHARENTSTISLNSLYCVCLSAGAHRDTKTHTTLSINHSIAVISHGKHTHSPKR